MSNKEDDKKLQEAFDDVIKAREDEVRARNEAETYANGLVPEARGEASKIMAEAEGYKEQVIARAEGAAQRFISIYNEYANAKDVTKRRIYLETMEELMQNTKKIIIDKNAGTGVVPYLPLPELKSKNSNNSVSGDSR